MSKSRDPFALVNVLVLSAVAAAALAIWVFADLGGWDYYSTPLRVRGYAAQHGILKPSGSVSHLLGLIGLGMLTMPVIYSLRKADCLGGSAMLRSRGSVCFSIVHPTCHSS